MTLLEEVISEYVKARVNQHRIDEYISFITNKILTAARSGERSAIFPTWLSTASGVKWTWEERDVVLDHFKSEGFSHVIDSELNQLHIYGWETKRN